MPLIDVKKATFSYDGKVIGENVTCSVEKGDYLCVLGANGTGKSTLLKGILGLAPHTGEITFEGLNKNEIGYLPQTTSVPSDFPASVKEVVMSGLISELGIRPFFSKKEKESASDMMKKLGVWDLRHKSFVTLSGGQRQRVLLCRALLSAKKVILLDEPVSGLDPVVTAEMYEMLKALNKEGLTVIMVSHDANVASYGANKILHLAEGGQLFFGPSDEYLDTDLAKYYLGGCCHR